MRSDAAPPLSQSIAPTMTGTWNFTPSADTVPVTVNAGSNLSLGNMLTLNPLTNEDTVVTSVGDVGVGEPVPTANLSLKARGAGEASVLALNPYAWWDAQDVNADGTNNAPYSHPSNGLPTWFDRSGNHDLNRSVAATCTLFKEPATTGPLNGPVGGPQDLAFAWVQGVDPWIGSAFGTPSGWCFFIVMWNPDLTGSGKHLLRNTTGVDIFVAMPMADEVIPPPLRAAYKNNGVPSGTARGAYTLSASATAYDNDWHSLCWSFNQDHSPNHRAFTQSGEWAATTGDANGTASLLESGWNQLFRKDAAGTIEDVAVSEMLLFDRALSNSERMTVQQYLADKYSGVAATTQPLQDWKQADGTIDSIVDDALLFGVGTSAPQRKLHVLHSGPQLRLGFDTDSYTEFVATSGSAAISYTLPIANALATVGILHNSIPSSAASTWSWSLVSLTADVSGILPIINGGTGSSTLSGAGIVTSAMPTTVNTVPKFTTTAGVLGNSGITDTGTVIQLSGDVSIRNQASGFKASFTTDQLTATHEFWLTDPVSAAPYVVTGYDNGTVDPTMNSIVQWLSSGTAQVGSTSTIRFYTPQAQLWLGDATAAYSPGITMSGSVGDATISTAAAVLPVVTYASGSTGGRHVFTGNPGGSFGVVTVSGRLDATTFNKMAITAPATSSTLAIADGKTFTVSETLTLTGTTGTTHTFPATTSSVARIDAAQTFAGVQTFSAQDVHTLGIDLSTSGAVATSVASGATASAFTITDSVSRSTGLEMRVTNSSLSRTLMEATWDGRYSFGYSSAVITGMPQTGHVLGFIQSDTDSPAAAPHQIGILALISHGASGQTITKGYGLVGAYELLDATSLTSRIFSGTHGSFIPGTDSALTGKIGAAVSGSLWGVTLITTSGAMEPTYPDMIVAKSTIPLKGSFDHITVFWANLYGSNTTNVPPTNKPGIVSSFRAPIQCYPASVTIGTPLSQNWGIYGEAPNTGTTVTGTAGSTIFAHYPLTTGFMRVPYPRFTAGTGTRAMQLFWEPWDHKAATGRANALEGDTYFADGVTSPSGLWEFSKTAAGGAAAWNFVLSSPGIDAVGAGAVAALGNTVVGAGNTGPQVAAQATWVEVNCADGVVRWVPAWV